MISDYNSEIGRGNESRIRELFRSFNDINIMGMNIPKFDSVERKDIQGEEYDIFCKTLNDVWIAEVSKSNINEIEIENIKRKIDKLKGKEKIKRVIIIPTKEINDEAVELCGDYNFDIWDLETINKLMKRAGMFRILI